MREHVARRCSSHTDDTSDDIDTTDNGRGDTTTDDHPAPATSAHMIATTDLAGVALVIVAMGSLVTACGGTYIAVKLNAIHTEVKTGNEMRIGELAAAEETRRTELIPHDQRTRQEQRHIDTAPEVGPAQGPDR